MTVTDATEKTTDFKDHQVKSKGAKVETLNNGDLLLTYASSFVSGASLIIPEGTKATARILVIGGGAKGSDGSKSNTGANGGYGGRGSDTPGVELAAGTYAITVGAGQASSAAGASTFSGNGVTYTGQAATTSAGFNKESNITGSSVTYGARGATGAQNTYAQPGTDGLGNGGQGGYSNSGNYKTGANGGGGVVIVRLTNLEELPAEGEADIGVPQGQSAMYTTSADLTSTGSKETGGSLLQSVTVSGNTATLTAKSTATIGGKTTVELRGASNKLIKILNVTITEKPKEISYRGRTIKCVGLADGNPTRIGTGAAEEIVLKFVKDGSLVLPENAIVDYLVVGGGGAGGRTTTSNTASGGGGAGEMVDRSSVSLASGSYTITVGAGGTAPTSQGQGGNGGDSSVYLGNTKVISVKGGGGGGYSSTKGNNGGSGGGGGGQNSNSSVTAGTATKGETTDGAANNGGTGHYRAGGGGGGAGGTGTNASSSKAGAGGTGKTSPIAGPDVTYACGGGGGVSGTSSSYTSGAGGSNNVNGGTGAKGSNAATAGADGTGSGGGGTGPNGTPGKGGSGVVIVRIKGFVETPAQDGEIVGSPVLTYDQTLAAVTTFTGTMKDSQGNAVTGTFAFNNKTTKPTVAQSGTTFKATFTPDSSMPWYQANSSVDVVVTVEKATPTVTAWPTASDIQQTQALSDSTLTGGSATPAGGTFAYADDMTLAVPGGLVLASDVTFVVPANNTLVVSDEMTISGSGKMIVAGEGLVDFLGDKVDVVAQGWVGTVDGEEHAPKVTATLTKFAPDQTPDRSVLVEYSTDGATWSITAPAFDAVGTHPVSYRVTVGGVEKETGSVDVVISKMQDQTISLSLLQSEVKTIEVVGAVPGEEWTVTVPAQSYVSVSPTSGSGKSFHVTFTAGATKTTSPVTVTIKCDSVTYTYNVSVVGAYEENKVNLAYGGEGFADEVTMYYWYASSSQFKPRHFQATPATSYNLPTEQEIATCNAVLDVDLKDTTAWACVGTHMAAKAADGSATICVWRSSDPVSGGKLGGSPQKNGEYPVVMKPKRVVYVNKTVEAYCYSSVGTGGSGQYTAQGWTGTSADASIATVTESGSAGASFKPVFTGVGVGRTYAIVEDVKETANVSRSGEWPSDATTEQKAITTANCTNGASYKLWVEVRDIPALQGTLAVSSIVYGQTLADSAITPGTMKDTNGNEVKGDFAWADSTIAPKVSDSGTTKYNVIFTPDNEFYDTVVLSVTVKVYAPLTVTAKDKEITRGHDLSEVTFDVEYDGFVGGDTPASLGGKLAFDCAYDKQTALAGEKYAITPKGLTSDKYAITFVDGNLTVVAPVLAEKILTDVDRSSGVNAKNLNDEEFLPVVVLENAPYYFDTDATNVAVEVRNASAFVTQDPYELTYGQIARFTLNGLLGANFGAAFLSEGTAFTGSFSTKTGEVDVVTFNGGTFTCPDDTAVAFVGEIALADDLEFDVADGKVVTIGADNVLSGEGKIVKTGDGLIDFAGDVVVVSAAGWTGTVDGETHSPTVGVQFTPFAEDNTFERTATVEYSTDDGDSWVTEVPAISAIGEHAIQYRVVVAGVVKESGDCDISISKMDDVEDTLKLGTDEEDMITCTGAFETDEWTVTTDTDGYEDYFTFDKTEGTGKTFQVILTTKGELTVKPIWVTIACGSVMYKYKVTVGAAGEEGAINLAYGGPDAADVVKISENNTTSGTPNRRYFKAALTGEGVKIDSTAAERGYYKEWTLTATASNKEAQVSIQVSSGDSDSNYSQTHADKIVTMGKRVAYVGKKLTAYCWSAYNNEWTFTSADPTIATVSGDTAQSTEAYVSITGVKPGKTSITVSNVKKSTSGNATQTGYEYTLWVEVREQPVLVDGTLTTTEITEGDALSKSTITGKMVNSKGEQVYGGFAWDDNTIIPTLADSEKTQYVVNFTPTAGSGDYYDQVKLVATVKVNQKITYIDVPAANGPFAYDGDVKIGVAGGDGYTLDGEVSATDAGEYTAIAKLVDGYAWKGDKTGDQKIKWSITQAKENVMTGVLTQDGWTEGETPVAADLTDVSATFGTPVAKYYTDEECENVFTPSPETAAGIYYVRAEVAGTANYAGAVSDSVSFTINSKPAIKITIERGTGVSDVQTNGVSVVGELQLPRETTEIALTLVKESLTIPVYRVITNDVTNVTSRVATYPIAGGLTLKFIAEEAVEDEKATPTETKQAIIDAVDQGDSHDAAVAKLDEVVGDGEGQVPADQAAEWITDNRISSEDIAESDFVKASMLLEADKVLTESDEVTVNSASGNVEEASMNITVLVAGSDASAQMVGNAKIKVTGSNGVEAVELQLVQNGDKLTVKPKDSATKRYTAIISILSDNGEKEISTQTLGYLQKDAYVADSAESKYARELVSVPWSNLANDGAITVENFLVTDNLAARTEDTPGTKIYSYVAATDSYNAWELVETENTKKWEPVKTVKIVNGEIVTQVAETPETATLPCGTGVWVERADATDPLVFVGTEYTGELFVQTVAGYNLLSAPGYGSFDLAKVFAVADPKDTVIVPQASGVPRIYSYKSGMWGYDDMSGVKEMTIGGNKVTVGKPKRVTNDTIIPPGTGFWYVSNGANPPKIPLTISDAK